MLPSLAGLALRRKSANVDADPSGVLDLQEIFNLVADQIARNNSANTLCQSLQSWCTAQQLRCTPEVYATACTVFGIDDEQKRAYLLNELEASLAPNHTDVLPDSSTGDLWEKCFKTICSIYAADTENMLGPVTEFANSTPFDLVQQVVEAERAFLPYEDYAKNMMARGRRFIAMAALGANREQQKATLMANTHPLQEATTQDPDTARLESIFANLGIPVDPSIWVQTTQPNTQPYYRRFDDYLMDLSEAFGTRWVNWLVGLGPGIYTPSSRNAYGYTAIEYLAKLQRNNFSAQDRRKMFVTLLSHVDAFDHTGPNGDTLLHILFAEIFDQYRYAMIALNLRYAIRYVFTEAKKRGVPTVRKVFFTPNAKGELPFNMFENMKKKFLDIATSPPFDDNYNKELLKAEGHRGYIYQVFREARKFCGLSNSSGAGPSGALGSSDAGPSGASDAGPSGSSGAGPSGASG